MKKPTPTSKPSDAAPAAPEPTREQIIERAVKAEAERDIARRDAEEGRDRLRIAESAIADLKGQMAVLIERHARLCGYVGRINEDERLRGEMARTMPSGSLVPPLPQRDLSFLEADSQPSTRSYSRGETKPWYLR